MKEDPRDPFVEVKTFYSETMTESWRAYRRYTCNYCGKTKDISSGENSDQILRKHLTYCPEFQKGLMFSKDEKAARKDAKEYSKAIDKYRLDNIEDGYDQSHKRYMMDSFFSGFYAGRNYERAKWCKKFRVDTIFDVKITKRDNKKP